MIADSARYIHLLAVALGLGVGFFADISVLGRLKAPLGDDLLDTLHWTHKIVTVALGVMWLTGAVLIYVRTGFLWENFTPKLVAKIIVISILTVNASLIALYAMPKLRQHIDQKPLGLPRRTLTPLALVSGASTTSWLLALALGSSDILRAAPADVFYVLLPTAYAANVLCCILVLQIARPKARRATDERTTA